MHQQFVVQQYQAQQFVAQQYFISMNSEWKPQLPVTPLQQPPISTLQPQPEPQVSKPQPQPEPQVSKPKSQRQPEMEPRDALECPEISSLKNKYLRDKTSYTSRVCEKLIELDFIKNCRELNAFIRFAIPRESVTTKTHANLTNKKSLKKIFGFVMKNLEYSRKDIDDRDFGKLEKIKSDLPVESNKHLLCFLFFTKILDLIVKSNNDDMVKLKNFNGVDFKTKFRIFFQYFREYCERKPNVKTLALVFGLMLYISQMSYAELYNNDESSVRSEKTIKHIKFAELTADFAERIGEFIKNLI